MCLWLLDLIYTVPVLKVDRLFEWKRGPNSGIVDTVKKQKRNTKQEFDERVQVVLKEFSEQVSEYATSCMGDLSGQTSRSFGARTETKGV